MSQKIIVDQARMEYELRLGVSTAVLAMTAIDDELRAEDFCDADQIVHSRLSGQLSAATKLEINEDLLICTLLITGPIDNFTELSVYPLGADEPWRVIEASRVNNNELLIISEFDLQFELDEAESLILMGMIAGLSPDQSFKHEVSAPEILYSNGTLSENGKTVNWEVPFFDALSGTNKYRFETRVKHSRPWWESSE